MNRRFWALLLVFALCLTLFVACDAPKSEETSGETESVGTSSEDETDGVSESTSLGESDVPTDGEDATEIGNESNGVTETVSETQTDEPTESETEEKIVEVDSVTINRTSLSLKVGERKTLSASVTPFGATNSKIVWSSDDESVATVSSSGVVFGVSAGTVTITASTANGTSASCIVTVNAKPSSGSSSKPETDDSPEWNPEETWGDGTEESEDPWWEETETETWWPSTETEYPWWDGSETEYPWWEETETEYPWWDETATETDYWEETETETDYWEETGEWDFVYYEVDEENCFIAWGGTHGGSTLIIPSVSPDGVPVTGIESYGFEGVKATNIVIPDSVTSIGTCAFSYCDNLVSIVIPDGVTQIEHSAFSDCTMLEKVELGQNTEIISDYAFAWCYELDEISLPDTVVSIESNAFRYTAISRINIPASVTYLSSSAFEACSCLYEITIDVENEAYMSVDSVVYTKDGENLIFYPCAKTDTSFEIPSGVTTIENNAFADCFYLETVVIPNTVTYIGDYAFAWSNLTGSVFIPASVMHIGESAFYGCSYLAGVNVDIGNADFKSVDGVLYSKDGATLIFYPAQMENNSFAIPDGVTSIGYSAFAGNNYLESVIIPDSVESIGGSAFLDCHNLSSVKIGSGVQEIGFYAFAYCWALSEITIPESVTVIEYGAFCDTALQSVTFESLDGWYIQEGDEQLSFVAKELQNTSYAAECIVEKYVDYTWMKE